MLSFETSLRLTTSLKYDVPMVTKICLLYDIIGYKNYIKYLQKVLKTHIVHYIANVVSIYNLEHEIIILIKTILIKWHEMGPLGPDQFYRKNILVKSTLMKPMNKNLV